MTYYDYDYIIRRIGQFEPPRLVSECERFPRRLPGDGWEAEHLPFVTSIGQFVDPKATAGNSTQHD